MIFKSNMHNFLLPQVHCDKFNIFVLVAVAFFAFLDSANEKILRLICFIASSKEIVFVSQSSERLP